MKRESRKSKSKNRDLRIALSVLIVVLFAVMLGTAYATYIFASKHFPATELDVYTAQEYSYDNSEAVMKALARGGKGLNKIMIGEPDLAKLLDMADWKNGEYEKKRSFGGRSSMKKANAEGQYEYSDMWVVPVSGESYIMYIQSVTSRYGRSNDGVSMIAVTTRSHYEETNGEWNPKKDEETVRAGKAFKARGSKK